MQYEVSADGSRIVYVADQDENDVFELFATFLDRRPRRSDPPVMRTPQASTRERGRRTSQAAPIRIATSARLKMPVRTEPMPQLRKSST